MQKNTSKKVLLYSGGMDSWLIDKLWKPDVKLFFRIGTACNREEEKRLPADVIIRELPLAEFEDKNKDFILPLRNLLFVEIASYYGDDICIGATAESLHFDNNEKFAKLTEELMNYLYSEAYPERQIKIHLPYLGKTKAEILAEYISKGGDIQEAFKQTFSCYSPLPNGKECGCCRSCIEKNGAFIKNGYKI